MSETSIQVRIQDYLGESRRLRRPFDIILKSGAHVRVDIPGPVSVSRRGLFIGKNPKIEYQDIEGVLEYDFFRLPPLNENGEINICYVEGNSLPDFYRHFDDLWRNWFLRQEQQQVRLDRLEHRSVKLGSATPVYADWKHLQLLEGGVRSIGIGFGFSISIGYQRSLMTALAARLRSGVCSVDDAGSVGAATFEVYVETITGNIELLQMEGVLWHPILLLSNKRDVAHTELSSGWMLAYYRPDCVMFPVDKWEKLKEPLRIYGDIINEELSTEIGAAQYFLKVRGAGMP